MPIWRKKKKIEDKSVMVEFHVWMHCDGCERTVAKVISKTKGVETFTTDIIRHQVTIMGRINPEKVAKRIKKKTGKIAEIMSVKECADDFKNDEDSFAEEMIQKQFIDSLIFEYVGASEMYLLFNDENANACSIM
ncbi:hypothetical protein AgCh_002694 [Apium graveolens]